ncbi:MAG: hypothetical protein COT67_02935 [Candidatus Tagabacteria bacterium CG09_land_8_20_14_0_10_41_14]|uniref:Uncharacterized protein n=1 Tax=Candidatus Tagabacteria bacterium CG09_land_8_20_14_0_10_41_14 TaxID=1975021 RepID=A0A2H0WKL7_9BACT|nr:MAG: hypothetical protein COT67_02935 [Candidatus Tagabacteria bacterium CG09_land_8_20_14_0_10_41_14]
MDEQILNKTRPIIGEAKSFAILLDKNPEEYELLSSEVLKRAISSKNLPLITLPQTQTDTEKKWSVLFKFLANQRFPRKTSLKLPKDKYGIKEVGYKEEEDNIALIITGDNGFFSKEDILLETLPPEPEVVFCFFENPSTVDNFSGLIRLPEKEKTIFITPNEQTLTEKVFQLIKILNPSVQEDGELNTILFASLLSETDNFQKNSQSVLSLATLLLKKGADQENIEKINETEKQTWSAQLLGRMLARTYTDELMKISWSFLTNRDFQKTGKKPDDTSLLYKIQNRIKHFLPPQKLYVLLWQTQEGVRALISSKEKRNSCLTPIAETLGANLQSYFFVTGPFKNFSAAEIYIKEKIKTINPIE